MVWVVLVHGKPEVSSEVVGGVPIVPRMSWPMSRFVPNVGSDGSRRNLRKRMGKEECSFLPCNFRAAPAKTVIARFYPELRVQEQEAHYEDGPRPSSPL